LVKQNEVAKMKKQLVIIGGGPAGMAAAVSAYDCGIRDMVILERDGALGGILQQCIHNGFGLHRFGEELTGPEYAWRYEEMVIERNIEVITNTMVLDVSENKTVTAMNSTSGVFTIEADAIILAMGCRERPRGALNIAGKRPAGIYTAGTAQKFVNVKGYMPGKDVVILGSGDIGLIMARRMTLEGAKVHAVCELMPYSGGLARNIEQCLHDFDIPLLLSHTVIDIRGKDRVEGITIAKVDENRRPIPGTEQDIKCDTLLLSCGLIPENELTKGANIDIDMVTNGAVVDQNRQTNIDGVYACGNVLHVHDLVDFVSAEAEIAGKSAANYIMGKQKGSANITLKTDGKVRYTVPQMISEISDTEVYFRVADTYRNAIVEVKDGEDVLYSAKKIKLAPGEMEKIKLSEKLLAARENHTLTFSIILNKGEEK
jgi:sarcosine oxidase subunit alpha